MGIIEKYKPLRVVGWLDDHLRSLDSEMYYITLKLMFLSSEDPPMGMQRYFNLKHVSSPEDPPMGGMILGWVPLENPRDPPMGVDDRDGYRSKGLMIPNKWIGDMTCLRAIHAEQGPFKGSIRFGA
ncbi:hypothetical protein TNCV_11691 [Trichonephila clavipes]|nr:hypothetical protein TNCV_11691 [Trichonephila clavipes]